MKIYRGDIFFVKKGGYTTGSEQKQGRPAVIVSNDMANENSPVVEVVYLTTQQKKELPTHVDIICKVPSIALCEQVHSVYVDRLEGFVKTCTDAEMKAIDKALMVSLGLDEYKKGAELADALKNSKAEVLPPQEEIEWISEEKIQLKTERDLYKKLYEQTLEKLIEN